MASKTSRGMMFLLMAVFCIYHVTSAHQHDYCIIGAGPAGLQMGYFMDRAGRDYVILERNSAAGSFFELYPRHRKLISINKRYTGYTNREFNFRHDWNSLISDDDSLKFRHYSKQFFPHADTMTRYLNDFSEHFQLNIKYNTTVNKVEKEMSDSRIYSIDVDNGDRYQCGTLIVATGMWVPKQLNVTGAELLTGYEEMSTDVDDYEGDQILILGMGNSAFETANHIISATSDIYMLSRDIIKLSFQTHYVGDVRAVNDEYVDTYQLKSLNAILTDDARSLEFFNTSNGDVEVGRKTDNGSFTFFETSMDSRFGKVIRCLGFTFNYSIFSEEIIPESDRNMKFPKLNSDYQMEGNDGLYVIGGASHSLDAKRSSGGFIHGFRYTVQAVHNILEQKNHGIVWPHRRMPATELLNNLLKRINEASALYQMFVYFGDVITIHGNEVEYFEDYPLRTLPDFEKVTGRHVGGDGVIVFYYDYGKNYSYPGSDVFRGDRVNNALHNAHLSNFLHPILCHYKKLPSWADMPPYPSEPDVLPVADYYHHIAEDLFTKWTNPTTHILPARQFIDNVLNKDMRYFFDETCFYQAMSHKSVPEHCARFLQGRGVSRHLLLGKPVFCNKSGGICP